MFIYRGPNDKIFINFVDHGSNGLLAFPDDYLYADQLNAALNSMYENSTYSKVTFIIKIYIFYYTYDVYILFSTCSIMF